MSPAVSGAREGRVSWPRGLVAWALARDLRVFVVPGPEVARARGLDLDAAGLRPVDTPRHASVLMVVGKLPAGLKNAAAVSYAQMPRPRAVLDVGAGDASSLPKPDASAGTGQEALQQAVAGLRRSFAEGAFSPVAPQFDVDEIRTRTEYVCPMHPEVRSDEPGSCPRCGMDLVPREAAGGTGHDQGHSQMDHEHHEGMEHGGGSGGHQGHGGHDHMDHGDMGFMSMVEITKDLPRSSDDLPMEWVEAPFGPLFPGLPGGLSLMLTLDGDTVARAKALVVNGWDPGGLLAGPAEGFAERVARLDPLSPVAYTLLATRAVEQAAGARVSERAALARVGAVERERAASHLNWLAGYAHLLGYAWLEDRAARLLQALLRAPDAEEIDRLRVEVRKLARRVERTPLLRRKLRGIGALRSGDVEALGPVARGAGRRTDARAEEGIYGALGFEPAVQEGGDSFSRLLVRLEETGQSLDLVREAGAFSNPSLDLHGFPFGVGAATVETPRGAATLRVTLEGGEVTGCELDAPSTKHLELAGLVAEGEELGDALVGVASLDISPWGLLL
jgi:Ni,Fe-hydrogenase III large subunit